MVNEGKTQHERTCQSISFISKTDHLYLNTSFKNESACLWKQLKWNKFPFYGDTLSWKIVLGD